MKNFAVECILIHFYIMETQTRSVNHLAAIITSCCAVELQLYFQKMKYICDFNVIHFDNFCHESNRLSIPVAL